MESPKNYLQNFSRIARLLLINICIHFSRKQCMIHWSGKSGIHISIFSDFKGILMLIFLLIPLAHCFFFLPTCQVFVVLLWVKIWVWEYHWYQGTYNEHIYLYTLAFITALCTIMKLLCLFVSCFLNGLCVYTQTPWYFSDLPIFWIYRENVVIFR